MVHWPSWTLFIPPPWWSTDFHFHLCFRVLLCTFIPIFCLPYVLFSTPSTNLWLIVALRGEPVFCHIPVHFHAQFSCCTPPMPTCISPNTACFSSHIHNPPIANNNMKHPQKSEVNERFHPAFHVDFLCCHMLSFWFHHSTQSWISLHTASFWSHSIHCIETATASI